VRDAAPIIVSADDAAKGASAGHRLRVLAELHATPADEPELDSPPFTPRELTELAARGYRRSDRDRKPNGDDPIAEANRRCAYEWDAYASEQWEHTLADLTRFFQHDRRSE